MVRARPTTHASRWPEYDRLSPAEKAQLRATYNSERRQRRVDMGKRDIHPERGINVQSLPADSTIPATIARFQWDRFIQTPREFDPAVVREFYACMHAGCFNEFSTVVVRGRTVRISVDDISQYLQLPRPELEDVLGGIPRIPGVGDRDEYSPIIAQTLRRNGSPYWNCGAPLLKSEMHHDIGLWMSFIKASIMPSKHTTAADQMVARILFCIHRGLPIDVAQIIHREIVDTGVNADTSVLPFPCLITHFCELAVVPLESSQAPLRDFARGNYMAQIRAASKHDAKNMLQYERVHVDTTIDDQEAAADDDDEEDEDYIPGAEEASTAPSEAPTWAAQIIAQNRQLLDIVTNLNHKVDQLQTSVSNIEQRYEVRRFGQGYERRTQRRRQADGSPSRQAEN